MSFRRNKTDVDGWRTWLKRNRDELIANCSVPAFIVNDRDRWWHFEHHGFDPESDWSIDMLSDEQARNLRKLVWREFGTSGFLYKYIDRLLEGRASGT